MLHCVQCSPITCSLFCKFNCKHAIVVPWCLHAALFVGFEVKSTEVFEDEGAIEVCIDVTGSSEEVTYYLDLFRISLEISATPDTAGKSDIIFEPNLKHEAETFH